MVFWISDFIIKEITFMQKSIGMYEMWADETPTGYVYVGF